jgi:hypothetical protein
MNNRIIKAVRIHIAPKEPLTSGSPGIRIDESANGRIVVTALEVVEPGFSGVAVAVLIFTGIL